MRKLCVSPLLIALFTLPLLAQADKTELFVGYSFERLAPGCGSDYRCGSTNDPGPATNLNGWNASFTQFVFKSFGLSAQFTGGYGGSAALSDVTIYRHTFQFGPAYAFPVGRTKLFAHALFGGVNQHSRDEGVNYTRFLLTVGGGLDFKVSRRLSIRPAQIDYERQRVPVVDTGGPGAFPPIGVNGLRYSAGIVFRY